MQDVPGGAIVLFLGDSCKDLFQICGLCSYFLQSNNVWGFRNNPLCQAFTVSGSNAIDVDGGNF